MPHLIRGYTLMHEHITIDLSGVKKDRDCCLDCFEETVKEFKELYALGVRNVLDVTNMGMGRNPLYVERVSKASGIQILHSTGFYKEPFLPEFVVGSGVEELSRLAVKEIRQGIEDTGILASVIGEFGTSKGLMTEEEKKIFDAMAKAAVETGVIVTTHTTLGTMGDVQADYLLEKGVKPDKIIIGHMDLSQDADYILEVLKKGVNIGFDTVGKLNYCPDTFRAETLKKIDKAGYLDHVVLSMDITRKTHLKFMGGLGYGWMFQCFLPLLRESGITESQIEQLLIENPIRILDTI